MRKTLGRLAPAVIALSVVGVLAGCSGGSATYSSPESLKKAYVEAGGSCDKSASPPESMVGEGAHMITCNGSDGLVFLTVFDTEDDKNAYLASTGDVDEYRVEGDRWLAAGENKDALNKLGGSEVKN